MEQSSSSVVVESNPASPLRHDIIQTYGNHANLVLGLRRRQGFPLHEAVALRNFDEIKKLAESGFDVNEFHYDRVTPLHMACLDGHLEIVKYLLEQGAWVNAQSYDNSTPLCDACAGGSLECVKYLLKCGAFVNPPLLLSTPLHEAALRGHHYISDLLISNGAHVNVNDLHYGTPLHAVCSMRFPNLHCIEILLLAGANVNALKIHKTPMHLLAMNSQCVRAAQLLIDYSANLLLQDLQGRKAKDMVHPGSDFALLLAAAEGEPRSLVSMCRVAIRRRVKKVEKKPYLTLPLPVHLINFVGDFLL